MTNVASDPYLLTYDGAVADILRRLLEGEALPSPTQCPSNSDEYEASFIVYLKRFPLREMFVLLGNAIAGRLTIADITVASFAVAVLQRVRRAL